MLKLLSLSATTSYLRACFSSSSNDFLGLNWPDLANLEFYAIFAINSRLEIRPTCRRSLFCSRSSKELDAGLGKVWDLYLLKNGIIDPSLFRLAGPPESAWMFRISRNFFVASSSVSLIMEFILTPSSGFWSIA